MTVPWLSRLVRRNVASVHLYGLMRSAMLAGQWLTRRPDEPDLLFLGRLPRRDDELVLDIGANGGQSAIAISFIRPRARIVSFEPLPPLWAELGRVKRLLGRRFEFRRYGLGRMDGSFPLYVPVSGELPMTPRASVSREAALANCAELERTVGLPTRLEQVTVEIRNCDTEKLEPMAIKIDVEGAEYEVIQGLRNTIEEHRPVLILERSESFENCAQLFAELGYDILLSEPISARERRLPGLSNRNWIASPPELTGYILAPPAG